MTKDNPAFETPHKWGDSNNARPSSALPEDFQMIPLNVCNILDYEILPTTHIYNRKNEMY